MLLIRRKKWGKGERKSWKGQGHMKNKGSEKEVEVTKKMKYPGVTTV